jgi:hypothetical protein
MRESVSGCKPSLLLSPSNVKKVKSSSLKKASMSLSRSPSEDTGIL